MTREEFVSKFKAGDKVYADNWKHNDFAKIVYISEQNVLLAFKDGSEGLWSIHLHHWKLYKPEPKFKLMAQAVCKKDNFTWIHDNLFESKEDAVKCVGSRFHSFPVFDKDGNEIWHPVPVEE